MPESPLGNLEVANLIAEGNETPKGHDRFQRRRAEIFEALLLAVVAVATAWSGYQAAKWDGHSAASFAAGLSSQIDGDKAVELGELELTHDISILNSWMAAHAGGNQKLAEQFENRFTDDYRVAFNAWKLSDPLNNPNAPRGPSFMPEYKNEEKKKGAELHDQGAELLTEGREAREIGEDYVRLTVLLAMALFLIAIAQRFEFRVAKLSLLGVSTLVVVVTLGLLIYYPVK